MTIGDLLKQYRINQNKTLQEFAGNIIDRSYYGKVERNVHQISAENLINLLRYNQIDATEFIETLDQNYQSQIQIQREIMEKYQVRESMLVKKSLFSLAINVLVLSIEENKFENIEYVYGDFLKYHLPSKQRYKVFSNIPFQITADIIKKITEDNNSAEEIFLIVQKEAAKKYCGIPYQKYEGLRAAVIKAQYHVEIMHTFNRSDFSPSPKVDTVLLHLKQKKNTLSLSEYKDFKDLVAYFYSQGKGKSSKDRLAVLFSNAQIRRLCKDNNINLLDSYTKITSEQWMNVFLYSRIGLTAEKKRLVGDAYKKLEKINKGLQKQNRTYLRKPSQSNSKSSTFNRRQKSLN